MCATGFASADVPEFADSKRHWQSQWHTIYWLCGGIYSNSIFCYDYLETIAGVLLDSRESELWAYDSVCEILVNPDGETAADSVDDRGEFFQRGRSVYINGELMLPEHRKQLGCEV
jgi:hypothetical protein